MEKFHFSHCYHHIMPITQELKKVWEPLDAQIAAVEQEEREAEEARLRTKEEARVAAKKACLEEEEDAWEQEHCEGDAVVEATIIDYSKTGANKR